VPSESPQQAVVVEAAPSVDLVKKVDDARKAIKTARKISKADAVKGDTKGGKVSN